MNITDSDVTKIRAAIKALQSILPRPERPTVPAAVTPSRCPVETFASIHLDANPACDLSCDEIHEHFEELVEDGQFPPIAKAKFVRLLVAAMQAVYGVSVCGDIVREGHTVLGYKGFEIGYEG